MVLLLTLFLGAFTLCYSQEDLSLCGQSLDAAETRIAAAIDTSSDPVGTWPWMVSIGFIRDSQWKHLCGSVIISQKYVLTAAHCVVGNDGLLLRLGDKNLNSLADDFGANTRGIGQVIVHPKYNDQAYYDLAILRVRPSITYTSFIRPICMPPATQDLDQYADDFVTVTGWGFASRNLADGGEILRSVPIKIYSQRSCNKAHSENILPAQELEISKHLPQLFTPNILCAGYERGLYGPCKGDSGSPLVKYNSDHDQYVLIGLVQGGIGSCGDKDFPSIFTRIDSREIHSFIAKETGLSGSDIGSTTTSRKGKEDILLIAGGSSTTSAEVFNLDDRSCNKFISSLPVDDSTFGSFFKHRGHPVYCDGYEDKLCYKYDAGSNSWRSFRELTRARNGAIKMELDGYLLIAGGTDGSSVQATTDYWDPVREEFVPGPELPYPAALPCIVAINQTHAMIMGGLKDDYIHTDKAYMFNRETERWTQLAPMQESRSYHACGLVGDSLVVVAGGYNGPFGYDPDNALSSVEVYDLRSQRWSRGPEFPDALTSATSVQLEDTFLIVGGHVPDGSLRTIYEYNRADNSWILREPLLNDLRDDRPAVWKLPASYLNCR